MRYSLMLINVLIFNNLIAQTNDSIPVRVLSEITVIGQSSKSDIHQLPEIVGTNIYAGKKSALVVLDNVQGNVVTNTMRQVFSKVPGIFIWESEGSGLQINVATRGLSPNRTWEFNVRQNGYDIAADPFGYPEAYYNPQLQSVQRIEIVRGHGALQYGAQIGGMINYILKNGSEFTKPFQIETFQSIGSNGLFNTYNAVGGKTAKINYYAFFDHRKADGWRANNEYSSNTGSGTFTYHFSKRFSLTTELTRWHSRSQQPGGLTDDQFLQNPRQSVRARNWFDLTWETMAITGDFKFSATKRLNIKMFQVAGDRNSVGYFPGGGIVVADEVDRSTGNYAPRTVDVDDYRNLGMETRYLQSYKTGSLGHTLSTGIRLYGGKTQRYRGGKGSSGQDYDLTLQTGTTWTGAIDYQSSNAALFVENLFSLSEKFLVIPGIRYEYLAARASGYSGLADGAPISLQNQERARGFMIGGLGMEYTFSNSTKIYANGTQSYRPVQFADLTTPPTTDVIDPTLTDARGLNIDLGYRGKVKDFLVFDMSIFNLYYDNRIGTIKQQRSDGSFYNYRTNVGGSTSSGIEAFGEYDLTKAFGLSDKHGNVSVFTSYAYNHARYTTFKAVTVVNNTLSETNYKNKQVEYAPKNILRTGISYRFNELLTTLQYSFTSGVFTDANNTEEPTANGQNGKIPSYGVLDYTIRYNHKSGFTFKGGLNNITDKKYFTRRSGGYPGPGVLPADGRTLFFSVGYKMS
ncbi:MAG: TonB-dependent receptor [Cyclobacteriaceae bacterium]|nr:TonB-dependent receptor [Cyclobacteriaceae bacterium]